MKGIKKIKFSTRKIIKIFLCNFSLLFIPNFLKREFNNKMSLVILFTP